MPCRTHLTTVLVPRANHWIAAQCMLGFLWIAGGRFIVGIRQGTAPPGKEKFWSMAEQGREYLQTAASAAELQILIISNRFYHFTHFRWFFKLDWPISIQSCHLLGLKMEAYILARRDGLDDAVPRPIFSSQFHVSCFPNSSTLTKFPRSFLELQTLARMSFCTCAH